MTETNSQHQENSYSPTLDLTEIQSRGLEQPVSAFIIKKGIDEGTLITVSADGFIVSHIDKLNRQPDYFRRGSSLDELQATYENPTQNGKLLLALYNKFGYQIEKPNPGMLIHIPNADRLNENKQAMSVDVDGVNDAKFVTFESDDPNGVIKAKEFVNHFAKREIPMTTRPTTFLHDYATHAPGYAWMAKPVFDFIVEIAEVARQTGNADSIEHVSSIADYLSNELFYNPVPSAQRLSEIYEDEVRGETFMRISEAKELGVRHAQMQKEFIDNVFHTIGLSESTAA